MLSARRLNTAACMQASAALVFTTQALIAPSVLWYWGVLLMLGSLQYSGAFSAAAGVGVIGLSLALQLVAATLSHHRLKMLRALEQSAGTAPGTLHMPPSLAQCLP